MKFRAVQMCCLLVVVAIAAALSIASCAEAQELVQLSPVTPTTIAPARPLATAIPSAPDDAPLTRGTIGQVARSATPGVVQITNERQVLQPTGQVLVPAGVGTGFAIDQQGHILTNNHVVANAQQLQVQTTDGRTFPARLTGRDPSTDLAVIQVEGQNLPVLALGDSNKAQVGEWVVAIGNALALEGGPTVTSGVVSALDRTVQEPPDPTGSPGPFLFDLIQTDAAINPGNSGGPLLDLNSQVIGVNTLGAVQSESGVPAQGINFAIAINTARRIADELIANGKVEHAFMGVAVIPNTPAISARFGLPNKPGLVVVGVVPGGPADQAGIKVQDVLTAVDNQPLSDESSLSRVLTLHKPGDSVTVTVARGNQTLAQKVTLGTAPPPPT